MAGPVAWPRGHRGRRRGCQHGPGGGLFNASAASFLGVTVNFASNQVRGGFGGRAAGGGTVDGGTGGNGVAAGRAATRPAATVATVANPASAKAAESSTPVTGKHHHQSQARRQERLGPGNARPT